MTSRQSGTRRLQDKTVIHREILQLTFYGKSMGMNLAIRTTTKEIEMIFFVMAKVPLSHWMIKSDSVFNLSIFVYLCSIECDIGSTIR